MHTDIRPDERCHVGISERKDREGKRRLKNDAQILEDVDKIFVDEMLVGGLK